MKLSIFLPVCYMLIFNLAGFCSMGLDKYKARKKQYRIPEKHLFLLAVCGGAFGSTCGIYFFRHKTRHWYFKLGMPLLSLLWIVILYLLL